MEEVATASDIIDIAESKEEIFADTKLFKQDVATAARKKKRMQRNIMGWLFSVWPFVGWCIFGGIPFVLSIILSLAELHNFDITNFEFIGFDNYKWIFTDPKGEFWFSMRQTLYYCLSLPIGIVLGLGKAYQVVPYYPVYPQRMFRCRRFHDVEACVSPSVRRRKRNTSGYGKRIPH